MNKTSAGLFPIILMALADPASRAAASDTVVVESLGGSAFVVHGSRTAREEALPSYALEKPPRRVPVRGRGPSLLPVFAGEDGRPVARLTFPAGTSFYGAGDASGRLLRNGRRTVAGRPDANVSGLESPSLCQSYPWVLAVRPDGSAAGAFADSTFRCEVDTGKARTAEVLFACEGPRFPVVLIDGRGPVEVVRELARLTGRMPMPPKWALGWHQGGDSDEPQARLLEVARAFRKERIPLDAVWVDLDYTDGLRSFTFDARKFPDPAALALTLSALGVRSVWRIEPGIRADRPGTNPPLDSGTFEDVWTSDSSRRTAAAGLRPGTRVFPDFTNPQARLWWRRLLPPFLAKGVDGVWNDTNGPAGMGAPWGTPPQDALHAGDPALVDWTGRPQGEKAAGTQARYHDVWGAQMARATREALFSARPGMRPFVLTRAGHLGSQRWAGTLTDSDVSSFEDLRRAIPAVLSLGLSGQPFAGPQGGGRTAQGSSALFSRWLGIASLLPLARGGSGKGTAVGEPWSFGQGVGESARRALERRYRLMPYLYTLVAQAAMDGTPVVRPLFFADPVDPVLRSVDDAFLLGGDVLVSARLAETGAGEEIRPKGEWRGFDFVETDPELPRLAIRAGAIVPLGPPLQRTDEKALDPLTLLVTLDRKGRASGTLYEDAGEGWGYACGDFLRSTYEAVRSVDRVTVRLASSHGRRKRPRRRLIVRLLGENGREAIGSGKDGETIVVRLGGGRRER